MNKEELNRLKNLFTDDSDSFFDEMQGMFVNEKEYSNKLFLFKNELTEVRKEIKDTVITREQYKIDFGKLSLRIFEFIDDAAEYLADVKLISESDEKQNNDFIGKSDQEYNLLKKLNFTAPLEYFIDLATAENPLLPFVIRGNGGKWFYHKLIEDYCEHFNSFEHIPLTIEFGGSTTIKSTFEAFLDTICEVLKIEKTKYESLNIKLKEEMIRANLFDRMQTQSQILIFKSGCTPLIKDFESFYLVLSNLSNSLIVRNMNKKDKEQIDTKCIMLFIENEEDRSLENKKDELSKPKDKFILPNHEDKFIFVSEKYPYEVADIMDREGVKFIDLGCIQPITHTCISKWLIHAEELRKDLNNEKIKKLISDCDNGHPDKVIAKICERMNINFEQKTEKWLKY